MSLFKKHLQAQTKLAEDMENDDLPFEAEEDCEDETIKTSEVVEEETTKPEVVSDEVLDEIGDAVEEAVEAVFEDVKTALVKSNARPQVISATLNQLRANGILVSNPYKNLKSNKITKKEAEFIKSVTNAATEAVEEILRASGAALIKRNYGKKAAALLDRRYAKNGYLRASVSNPTLRPTTKKQAQKAAEKTRKSSNILGLQ